MTEITPAHKQSQVQALSSAGCPPMVTVGDPGTQGEAVAGMQGCGARRALMTAGFVGLLHSPKGLIFANGAKSMIVAAAASLPAALTGEAANAEGVEPKLQVNTALSTTRTAMVETQTSNQRRSCGLPGGERA
jgi:hypothetical protein